MNLNGTVSKSIITLRYGNGKNLLSGIEVISEHYAPSNDT
jgi:hypothetical protein